MATKRIIPLNKIEGVVAGGTAVIDLPTNVRYHAVFLQYDTDTAGGATEVNMEAEIKQIRVDLGEVTQRKASPSQIFDINRSKGITPTVGDGTAQGYIPIFFSEPQRATQEQQEATAWGMLGVTDFQIEIDINDAGQVPSLKGFAIVDDVQEAPMGIVKWKHNVITIAATGETPYALSTTGGDSYQGLYLFETAAGDIDELLIEWDGVKMYQLTEYQDNAYIEQFLRNANTVSKLVHVPFDCNVPKDALRTFKTVNGVRVPVQELICTLNMGAANNVTIISEKVGLPD